MSRPARNPPDVNASADGTTRSTAAARRQLSRHLTGKGIELGPGHVPFPRPAHGVEVSYVDRWRPEENRLLFPELGEQAAFVEPDVVCNFDTEGLSAFEDESQDHVIASHMLEHVANPLALLHDIHRVLRPGGILILLLPDRHRTFDRDREPTPLSHVINDHDRGVTMVEDHHVAEFLTKMGLSCPQNPGERQALFDLQRRRSVHVHVWTADEFFEVLVHANAELGHAWELVDAVLPQDEEEEWGCDFGWVLRRATCSHDPATMAARLEAAWGVWRNQRLALHAEREELAGQLQAARGALAAVEDRVADLESRAGAGMLSRLLGLGGRMVLKGSKAKARGG